MEWRDEGIVLAVKRHGEQDAIIDVLTAEHGRSQGLVKGGRSRRQRPVLQSGNIVQVVWRARLEEHLGNYSVEPLALQAGAIMEHPLRLACLGTLAGLAGLLPEREPHRRLYDALHVVLSALDDDKVWPALLVRWELGLLDELGFGLDLSRCAATGGIEALIYVSPRTGRAVSAAAGEPYRDRLFRLPAFLAGNAPATNADIVDGLRITGYFMTRHLFEPRGIAAPEQRDWIVRALAERNR